MRLRLPIFLSLCTIATTVIACGNNSSGPAFSNSSGGGQLGGSSSSAGGASSTNSSSSTLTGGTQATGGGGGGAGGTSYTGTSTGGTSAGGTKATGGSSTSAVGGTSGIAKGGTTSGGANGGVSTTINGGSSGSQPKGGSGGSAGTASAKGGASTTGGSVAAGGMVATGGVEATGGASACSWSSAPSSDSGYLTCYWFSQGTGNNFKDCPGKYKTACGYCGTETGKHDTSKNYPCAIGEVTDSVEHMSTAHFVAFPAGAYAGNNYCGMCVEVTHGANTITATIVDNCASCPHTGDLDLSLSAAEALGMGGMIGTLDQGVTWKAVACPVTDNIYVLYNGGLQTNQAYFQNVVFPVVSVKYDGKTANQYGSPFWSFDSEMAGKTVTLTDVAGHTIQGTMPSTLPGGSLGVQFPLTCQ